MDELHLPDDFKQFLQNRQQLNFDSTQCETGAIALNSLSELKLSTFLLQTYASPIEEDDPHREQAGFYHVPAVSLLKECENYYPQMLLVWLPQESLFGTGDEEHGHLLVFSGATWTNIASKPIPYLEAQWTPDSDKVKYLCPWPRYDYVELAG